MTVRRIREEPLDSILEFCHNLVEVTREVLGAEEVGASPAMLPIPPLPPLDPGVGTPMQPASEPTAAAERVQRSL